LMYYYNVLNRGSEEIFDNDSTSWIYFFQDKTEYLNQAPVMVAALKHAGLLDRIDENGVPNFTKKEEKEFKLLIGQLMVRIHGNYDPTKPIMGTKKWVGRAAVQFRKWAIEGFANRFEVERPDGNLGKIVKGRYRSGWDFVTNNDEVEINGQLLGPVSATLFGLKQFAYKLLSLTGTSSIFGWRDSYNENWDILEQAGIKPVDIANLKRNMHEAVIYLGIMALSTLFKIAGEEDPDDPEKGSFNANFFLYNQLLRMQTDILFYSSPDEFNKIISNPVASMRLYTDLSKIVTDYYGIVVEGNNNILQSGPYKHWNKNLVNVLKTMPFSNQLLRIQRLGHDIY